MACEVEFAGLGADTKAVVSILGGDAAAYTKEVREVLFEYAQRLRDGKREDLADPNLLARAIPIFMRGAYMRNLQNPQDIGPIKELDSRITLFVKENVSAISAAFIARSDAFSKQIENTRFTVGRGYINVSDPLGDLTLRYMPAE